MGSTVPNEMVWVDIETTGLSQETDLILEIAVAVTDVEGNVLDYMSNLVHHTDIFEILENLDPVVKEMHKKSGLAKELQELAIRSDVKRALVKFHSLAEVEKRVLAFLQDCGLEPGVQPMCGSSVHFDRGFIREHMETLNTWFHYRNVDISSVKTLCSMLNPPIYARKPEHTSAHRAEQDVFASIAEYQFYMDNFLHVDLPVNEAGVLKHEVTG